VKGVLGSARRLFATYLLVSLVPVLVLGFVLTALTDRQLQARGLAQTRSEARLLAGTVVAPLLEGRTVGVLQDEDRRALSASVASAVANHEVLRLRLRDLTGHVVFADDGKLDVGIDDEALEAARGEIQASFNTLDGFGALDPADSLPVPGRKGPFPVRVRSSLSWHRYTSQLLFSWRLQYILRFSRP